MLMGMAASQARYLALTARKSNVEYEGQQINQARTALANQTANLFNQMLSMEVPAPPSVRDFTTVQYSYSDGFNTEVLSNYYQLGNADSDYNYVVTSYHNAKVFQGSRKKMNDPQVQATYTDRLSYSPSSVDNNISRTVTKAVKQADGSYFIQESNGTTKSYRPVTLKEEDYVKAINHGMGQNEDNPTVNLAEPDVQATFKIVDNTTADQLKELGELFGYTAANYVADESKVDLSDASPQRATFQPCTDADLAKLQSLYGADASIYRAVSASKDLATAGVTDFSACTDADLTNLQVIFGANAEISSPKDGTPLDLSTPGSADDFAICDDTNLATIQKLFGDSVTDPTQYYVDSNGVYISAEDYGKAETGEATAVANKTLEPNYYKNTAGEYITAADYAAPSATTDVYTIAADNYYKGQDASGNEVFITRDQYEAKAADTVGKTATQKTMSINANNKDAFIDIDTNDADMVAKALAAIGCTEEELADYMFFNSSDVNAQGFVARADVEAATDKPVTKYAVDTFSKQYYWNGTGYVSAADYDAGNESATLYIPESKKTGIGINTTGDQTYYTDGTTFVTKADLDAAVASYNRYITTGKKEANTINEINVTNDPAFSNYTAVGNCKLTEVLSADFERDEALNTEIMQIIKDMKGENGDLTAAANLEACFDIDSNGDYVYKGGIYQFQMGGTTYYTTRGDLDTSLNTSIVDNDIDVQQEKLRYYNGIYVDTKVEDTKKALLETDGQGRFTTVRFEDDNISYTLNVEETTNEEAYNDAMNRYYYENAEYEKNLADINAKTETIQAQDRTLELRLEQLNTEQNALQNEMEAVKKVVDKHVELGFKTFGG